MSNTTTEYLENLIKLNESYQKMIQQCLEHSQENQMLSNAFDMPEMFSDLMIKAMEDPDTLYKKQLELFTNYSKIWGNVLGRYLGDENTPLYNTNSKDRRFKDQSWDNNILFDYIKQSYLLTSEWIHDLVGSLEKNDEYHAKRVDFFTRQFVDALSPTNFAHTNPEVIKETLDSKGQNLIKGFQNMCEDLENSKKFFNIRTTDMEHFEVGRNLAITNGKVVYRNELIELIQYSPTCKQTFEIPLLLIPAWINKFYIFDLSPEKSMVKWALDKGYTIFVISWVNPEKGQANTTFDDYMLKGPLAAIDAIEKATGAKEVSAMGYCLGGTLLTCTMAYMAAKGDSRIKAATLLTTLVDFSQAGDMSLFINEEMLTKLNQYMQKTGYLDGDEMAAIFSVLRANDLVWSFVVNNYLLGREPFPFDILYWNADSTRLPAATHSFYLSSTYLENALIKPGGIALDGVPIDISRIKTPTYIFATQEDHIAPWGSCYQTTKLLGGNTCFVLGASGHISGVINPPQKNKYCFWKNTKKPKTSNQWLSSASQTSGSWWDDWHNWNHKHSGKKIAAPKPGSQKLKSLCDAPGTYVKKRLNTDDTD